METARILIVEDERIVAKDLQLSLSKLGYKANALAYSGREALRAAHEYKPDIVIMDIMLNDAMDGIEAAEKIRQQLHIPVIFLSAYSDEETLQRAKISEPFGYILKPYEERELQTAIEMAIYKHRMERILKEREQWLTATLTSIGDAVITTDRELNITFMNPVALSLTNFQHEQIQGKPLADVLALFPSTEAKKIYSQCTHILKSGSHHHMPQPFRIPKTGTAIDVNLSPIRDVDQSISGVVLTFRDISDYEDAKQALVSSEALFRSVWEHSIDAMRLTDSNGMIVRVNRALSELTGLTPEALIGQPFNAIYHESEKEQFPLDTYIDQFRQKKFSRYLERWITFQDGTSYQVQISNSYLETSDHGPLLLSIFRDITPLKEVQQQLQESEEKYRALFEHNLAGVGIADENSNILEANPALCAMMDINIHELHNLHVSDFYYNPADRTRILYKIRKQGFVENYELPLKRRNGEIFWVSASSIPIRYGNKQAYLTTQLDITSRKTMEMELKESRERYRVFSEMTSDFVYGVYFAPDGSVSHIWASDAIHRISGYPASHFSSLDAWIAIIHPDDKASSEKQIEQLMAGESSVIEYRIFARDGGIRWLRDYARPVVDEKTSKVVEVLGAIQDITPQKLAMEALSESEERFRTLFESAQDIIFIKDKDGRYTQINPVVEQLIGIPPDKFIGRTDDEIFGDGMDAQAIQSDKTVLQGQIFEGEERTEVNGHTYFMHIIKVPLRNSNGDITGIYGIARDITERKRVADTLNTERERLAVTLRSIADGVIATDQTGHVMLINGIAERLTGWKQQEALGKEFFEVFSVTDEITGQSCQHLIQQVIDQTDTEFHRNSILRARDGTETIVACSAAPIKDKHDHIFGHIFVFRDITNQRKYEAELQKASKLESIGLLAGGIAHDFNNILTVILSSVSLSKMIVEDNAELLEILSDMEKATLRAQDLTQQLLTFSKGGAPVKQTISVATVLRESTQFSLRGSQTTCQFVIPNDLWPVDADKGQLSQVINNLIINADQAMPEGGTIDVQARNLIIREPLKFPIPPGKYIQISIRDHGIGILQEHLPKIYDPYFTTKQSGSGLGLTTSYSIIQKHGGYIDVESQVGKGTTFHIYLPASSSALVETDTPKASLNSGHGTILLMDDEQVVRKSAGRILSRLGYDVLFAEDGKEALRIYKQALKEHSSIDLVILDLTVPGGVGGKETLQKLKQIDPDVRAIVSSGYSNDPVMSHYQDFGFHGMVQKPYRIDELATIIKDVLKDSA